MPLPPLQTCTEVGQDTRGRGEGAIGPVAHDLFSEQPANSMCNGRQDNPKGQKYLKNSLTAPSALSLSIFPPAGFTLANWFPSLAWWTEAVASCAPDPETRVLEVLEL